MMSRIVLIAAVVMGAAALAGCAHKPLKAPCSRDEGPMQQMAFAALEAKSDAIKANGCGPMQPLNSDPPLLPEGR